MAPQTLEARALKQGSPVIDGDTATFVWRGRKPVLVHGDFQDWSGQPLPLERVSPSLWTRTLTLPRDAYVEYSLSDARGRKVEDPLNRQLTDNGFGGFNHSFSMPEHTPTPLARQLRGKAARGRITRHQVQTWELAVGDTREVVLYEPPVAGPHPLVVVLDGTDYLRRASLVTVVDNLIREKRIRPVALAMVANGGPARTVEYACSEATLGFLLNKVLPLAREKLPLIDERRKPGVHGVLGASLGGLMALYTGMRAPHVFGRVLSQSGAFALRNYDFVLSTHDFVVFELARAPQRRRLSVWLDCGSFERLTEGNRLILPVLEQAGHRVHYREYSGGHNYPAWRDDVWRGLEWLYPYR
ncbi:alpha/beta hydrolase-fold protein [Hyalangium gracile]|uniref:alpha/beta hydrolase-fold protein n=1 Tax=Hyalangium gracile TaxID=394092 RepID=UPI001CCF5DDB|nr:alpha/beta hydrolase-fold protein [Hyalangium gracile]